MTKGRSLQRQRHLLGTPDTSRSGLSTRKALSALTSKPAPLLLMGAVLLWMMLTCSRITVKTLERTRREEDTGWREAAMRGDLEQIVNTVCHLLTLMIQSCLSGEFYLKGF